MVIYLDKDKLQSTLFVGIDVSSSTNYAFAMDFFGTKFLSFSFSNNQPGSNVLVNNVSNCLRQNNFKYVVFNMESTSFYSFHLCCVLASSFELAEFKPLVYCLNPKVIAAYRESFVCLDKTDPLDAKVICDFARVGKITSSPFNASTFLALQRLTRQRLHVVECLTREKQFILNNIFLKFSELAVLEKSEHPFSDKFGATAVSVITDFYSPDEIANMPLSDLIEYLNIKGKNRFTDTENTAKLLQKAARDSYRLDKALYEPINLAISTSFNAISLYQKQLKDLDKAILKTVKGLHSNEYDCLLSIKGIGPVYAAGIISEIGFISRFAREEYLASFAGLTWKRKQSGKHTSDITNLTKSGNKYLRYYLLEAVNSVINHGNQEYSDFFHKKYSEVTKFQRKRALALTARKFVRLIFSMLQKNQLYINPKEMIKLT